MKRSSVRLVSCVLSVLLLSSLVRAELLFWQGLPPDTSWFDEVSWSGGVPDAGDGVVVGWFFPVEIDSGAAVSQNLMIGGFSSGSLVQTGGTNTTTDLMVDEGDYALSGTGALLVENLYVAHAARSDGSFTQSGGTCTVTNTLKVGYGAYGLGTYTLSGGQLTAGTLKVGVQAGYLGAVFNQSGGSNHVTGMLYLGSKDSQYQKDPHGIYRLSGGQLDADGGIELGDSTGGSGRLEWFGGTINTPSITLHSGSRGTLTMGFDFDAGDLANGVLLPGTTINGLDNATLEITNGATVTNSNVDMKAYKISIGTSQGGATYNLSGTGRISTSESSQSAIYVGCIMPFTTESPSALNINGMPGAVNVETNSVMYVGQSSTATVTHTSGTVNARVIQLGGSGGSTGGAPEVLGRGTYLLSGTAELNTDSTQLRGRDPDRGLFIQDGGTHRVANDLEVGSPSYSYSGTYEMRSGDLIADRIIVSSNTGEPSLFKQTGGTVNARYVKVDEDSRFEYTGGTLQIDRLTMNGELDLGGYALTMSMAGGVVDFSGGQFVGTSNANMSIGPDTLMIVSPGFDPDATFAQFSLDASSVVYTKGSPLVIPAGANITAWGDSQYEFVIEDLVQCEGNLAAGAGYHIRLDGGLMLSGDGNVDLGTAYGATVTVADETSSGMSGGQLTNASMTIGTDGTGRFLHTGGEMSQGGITVGSWVGSSGTYEISGTATLTDVGVVVGHQGTGVFRQIGTTCQLRSLVVGGEANEFEGYSSDGTYEFSGGSLSASNVTIGDSGIGRFLHTAGTFTVANSLTLADRYDSQGTYELSGSAELVISEDLHLSPNGRGVSVFKQMGGTSTVGDTLWLGGQSYGSSGGSRYELSAGSLQVNNALIEGEFIQTGGTSHFEQKVEVGSVSRDVPEGVFQLSGGVCTSDYIRLGVNRTSGRLILTDTGELRTSNTRVGGHYDNETGVLVQDGGSHYTDLLTIASLGTYTYTGGTLEAKSMDVRGEFDFAGSNATLMIIDGGDADFSQGTLSNAANASIVAGADTLLRFAAGFDPFSDLGSLTTQGLVHVAGEALDIPAGTTVSGTGIIDGDLNNSGSLAPGHSPGILEVDGDFSQAAVGSLVIEMAGASNGDPENPQYDVLNVTGTADLGGAFLLVLLNGYELDVGQEVVVLTAAGGITGAFDSITGGCALKVVGLDLVVSLAGGDINQDGIVDLQDFSLLKANFGQAGSHVTIGIGDLNGDQRVDLQDFSLLKTNFGTGGAAVPEPSTLMLLATTWLVLARRRRT